MSVLHTLRGEEATKNAAWECNLGRVLAQRRAPFLASAATAILHPNKRFSNQCRTFHSAAKWTSNSSDPDNFYNIPRTRDELAGDSITWVQVEGNAGDPFTIHCEDNNERYCAIYDNNGFIAGQQYGVIFMFIKFYFLE
jgi:hypothetical protein